MAEKLKILIVDDHPLFRRGLRQVIEERSKHRVIAEASDGKEALCLINELSPEVAIVDIALPQMNGLELVRCLRKGPVHPYVIFLTMYEDEDLFNAAMDLGVRGYVVKDSAVDEILKAIEKVVMGEIFVSDCLASMKSKREAKTKELLQIRPQISALTPTERKILKLISEDRTSKEIATMLGISVKTVENHRQNICHKLGLRGSHSLLRFAFENRPWL
jgi:DNA-binding NarL/FixJ family response regulator